MSENQVIQLLEQHLAQISVSKGASYDLEGRVERGLFDPKLVQSEFPKVWVSPQGTETSVQKGRLIDHQMNIEIKGLISRQSASSDLDNIMALSEDCLEVLHSKELGEALSASGIILSGNGSMKYGLADDESNTIHFIYVFKAKFKPGRSQYWINQ